MPRTLVTSFYDRQTVAPCLARLDGACEVVLGSINRTMSQEELIAVLDGVDVVIAAEERYTAEVFRACPRLRMIARDGVGIDSIDVQAATNSGVLVNIAPVVHESVADLTFGLILAVVRKIVASDSAMRRGDWTQRDLFLSPDVNGMTLGLIGFGNVGKAVARRAAGFDMRVLYHDPNVPGGIALDDVLSVSDIISIHVPLTAWTERMINSRTIERMKDGTILINTARGAVVDEHALFEALRSGKLAGAGLDVLSGEPPSLNEPLLCCPNVVFTPHIGSDTFGTFRKVFDSAVTDILLFLKGEPPRHMVNPLALFSKQVS
jgi:phosphoglycerate dehydrogenase-like enzyme